MSAALHTPEPWTFGHFGDMALWIGPSPTEVNVAEVAHDCSSARENSRENARRIVACVNACIGMPLTMQPGCVQGLVDATAQSVTRITALIAQRDELAAALRQAQKVLRATNSVRPFGNEGYQAILAADIALAKGSA